MYEGTPELLDLAMETGRTQNVVFLKTDLSLEEIIHVWHPITTK